MGYYGSGKTMSASDFRRKASDNCKLAGGDLTVTYLVYYLITGAISALCAFLGSSETFIIGGQEVTVTYNYVEAIIKLLVSGPFIYSLIYIAESVSNRMKVSVGDLFVGFGKFLEALAVNLLTSLYTFLWTLLFIVPGIIKTYSYSMAMYIKRDNPHLSANECIKLSKKLMDGHKWDLFCLHFSYIGWILLSGLTFGILFLWVAPKIQQAEYLFYKAVSGKE